MANAEPPSSEQKLTQGAFEKIRAAATGNTIDPEKIELLGSDETTLTVKAEMTLRLDMTREKTSYPGAFRNARNMAKGRAVPVIAGQMEEKITELKTKATTGNFWCKDAARQIKAEPGEGWGLEKADVILDSLAQIYYSETPCTTCGGSTTVKCDYCRGAGMTGCTFCRETGMEPCYNCYGSGLNPSNQEEYCYVCTGRRQINCRQCQGNRQMQCQSCRGQGKIKCTGCGGNGKFTQEEYVAPVAKAEFHITESAGLPSGFRRAISRAGTKSLAKGHATITCGELVEPEVGDPFIPYTATLPFAEMRLRIKGKATLCSVMGHKGVILDLPPFLDTALEPLIAEFETQAKKPDTLAKALKIRICQEAFGLLQLNRADAKSLRQLYPAGLTLDMAQRILVVMRSLVHGQTITTRLVAALGVIMLLAGADYGILAAGLRAMLAGATKPAAVLLFDIIIAGLSYVLVNLLLRFAAAMKLQRQLGGTGRAAAQSAGGIGIGAGILAALLYVLMLFALKAEPAWQAILAHPF